MARRSKEEMEQTRLALLEAALNLFAEKGYSKTTLADIASGAGFTRGAVYWHFKDKPMIFNEVMDHYAAPIRTMLGPALDGVESPREWIASLFKGFMDMMSDKHTRKAMFVRLRKTEYPEELQPYFTEKLEEWVELRREIQSMVQKGIDKDDFRKDLEPAVVAETVLGCFLGLAFTVLELPSQAAPDTEMHAEVLIKGLES